MQDSGRNDGRASGPPPARARRPALVTAGFLALAGLGDVVSGGMAAAADALMALGLGGALAGGAATLGGARQDAADRRGASAFRALYGRDSTPAALSDREGRILAENAAMAALTGGGGDIRDIFGGERAAAEKRAYRMLRGLRRDGRPRRESCVRDGRPVGRRGGARRQGADLAADPGRRARRRRRGRPGRSHGIRLPARHRFAPVDQPGPR